jgi:hypothetical protein
MKTIGIVMINQTMGPRGTKVLNQNGVENSLTKTGWWFQPL